jgi:hypothetical protein
MAGHETLKSSRKVELGSNRNFGLVFAGVFGILAFWPLIRHGEAVRWWAVAPAAVFLGLALYADHLLTPLNKLWFRFGLLLHSVVSPLVMGALFFGAVTPFAYALRLMGKDILRPAPPKTRWASNSDTREKVMSSFLKEFVAYLRTRKKFWLVPLLVLFLMFGALFFLGQGSVVAPFIYTLF